MASSKDDMSAEVDRYLNDCSSDLSSLNAYPHIKQLYVALNTGLPASAAVERVFSLGGRVFSPLRTKLSTIGLCSTRVEWFHHCDRPPTCRCILASQQAMRFLPARLAGISRTVGGV